MKKDKKEKIIKKLKNKKGIATAETLLLIAVLAVVIVTIFFPAIQGLITNTLASISGWFTSSLINMGI